MFKRILVYTYGDQSHKHTLEVAAKFAADQEAHLTGLYIKPDYANYSGVYGPYPFALIQNLYEKLDEHSQSNEKDFEKALDAFGTLGEWHSMDQYAEGPNPALYSDCIFVSQPKADESVTFSGAEFIDNLLLTTGIPVIMVPEKWKSNSFGQRPVLAWKESKEAASAVRHSMSFMRNTDGVDVVNIVKKDDPEKQLIDGIQISEYLTAHGLKSEFKSVTMSKLDSNETDTLIDYVERNHNDLIIMGGYSHSRLRETFFGGMTKDIIDNSEVPVLLAH
jgi:nucleotide-binding universal stress UspA family protein